MLKKYALMWMCVSLLVTKCRSIDNVNKDVNDFSHYSFRYYVRDDKTGDFKSQEEKREGNRVKGSYTVAEPNGDLRTVTYTAGDGRGFEAIVDIKPGASPMKKLSATSAYYMEMKRPVDERDMNVSESGQVNTYAVSSNDTNTVGKDDVQEEVNKIIEEIPPAPELHILDDKKVLKKDEDDDTSIDERITEVARQLAETSLRQEYEDRKLAHIIPIRLLDNTRQEQGKSYDYPPKALPLVARLPVEMAQLQLITEVQTIPQHVYREGFFPVTPAPELSGPLLGGPPLKDDPMIEQDEPVKNTLTQAVDVGVDELKKEEVKTMKKKAQAQSKSIKLNRQQGKAMPFLLVDSNNQIPQWNKEDRIVFYIKPEGNGRGSPMFVKIPSVRL